MLGLGHNLMNYVLVIRRGWKLITLFTFYLLPIHWVVIFSEPY